MKTPTTSMPPRKWYDRNWMRVGLFIIGTIFSSFVFIQNFYLTKENDAIREQMTRELQRVNHRLDARDAYRTKGLYDGAKRREEGYRKEREKNLKIIAWCEQNGCELPPELGVPEIAMNFESLESIIISSDHKE
jgi:hypothetical protein